jgi:small GTP-binding protein
MQQLDSTPPASSKVVMLGDSRVGKTSIISRQILGHEPDLQTPTIGCHCTQIRVPVEGKEVILQVWDTAGQEMYRSLVPVYLRNVRAALLVYDVTERDSFQSLGHWHDILHEAVGPNVAIFIVANKIDLSNQAVVDDVQADQFAEVHNGRFFKVSAVTGIGLNELFVTVARTLSERFVMDPKPDLEIKEASEGGCGC